MCACSTLSCDILLVCMCDVKLCYLACVLYVRRYAMLSCMYMCDVTMLSCLCACAKLCSRILRVCMCDVVRFLTCFWNGQWIESLCYILEIIVSCLNHMGSIVWLTDYCIVRCRILSRWAAAILHRCTVETGAHYRHHRTRWIVSNRIAAQQRLWSSWFCPTHQVSLPRAMWCCLHAFVRLCGGVLMWWTYVWFVWDLRKPWFPIN